MLFHGCATQTSGDLKTQNISACQESIKVKSKGRAGPTLGMSMVNGDMIWAHIGMVNGDMGLH